MDGKILFACVEYFVVGAGFAIAGMYAGLRTFRKCSWKDRLANCVAGVGAGTVCIALALFVLKG